MATSNPEGSEGIAVFLKDKDGQIICPVTHEDAVFTYDGSISLAETLDDIRTRIPTKTSQLTNDSGFVTSSSATFVTQTHTLTASGLSAGNGWSRTTTLTKAGYTPLTTASLLYGPSEDGFEYNFTRFTARGSGTCTVEWYCKNAYNGSKTSVTVKLDIIWIKQ